MRKYFYILITLLAVLSIGFVGCKNKPTTVSDFIDEAGEKTPGETLNPDAITINVNQGPLQYEGKTFESTTRKKPDGTDFKYKITFRDPGYTPRATVMDFVGYDKEGKDISATYTIGNKIGGATADKHELIPYQFNIYESSELIIYKSGLAKFKPRGFNSYIELAYKKTTTK